MADAMRCNTSSLIRKNNIRLVLCHVSEVNLMLK